MEERVIMEQKEGLAILWLNRPQAFNAFDMETMTLLAERLTTLAVSRKTRAVVISGKGKAFCAGGDLRWAASQKAGAPAAFHALAGRFHVAVAEIRRMPKPVVAAINGIAAGGGFSLALACDFRIMARSALLRQAYTSAGLSMDGGGTFTLPRLVGQAKALEIAALDEPISAQEALRLGLVTRVVDDGKALEEALSLVRILVSRSIHAFAWAKRLLNTSFQSPLELVMEEERAALEACAGHPDGQEGLRAFLEKRPPQFVHREEKVL